MCQYRTLYYDNKNGYVIFCESCRRLQLGFGCILIHFNQAEFKSFRRMLSGMLEDDRLAISSTAKAITIPTPCEGISLLLSPAELNTLHLMVDEADTALCVIQMMNCF